MQMRRGSFGLEWALSFSDLGFGAPLTQTRCEYRAWVTRLVARLLWQRPSTIAPAISNFAFGSSLQ